MVSGEVEPKAHNLEPAKRFVAFLASPVAIEALKKSGLVVPDSKP